MRYWLRVRAKESDNCTPGVGREREIERLIKWERIKKK